MKIKNIKEVVSTIKTIITSGSIAHVYYNTTTNEAVAVPHDSKKIDALKIQGYQRIFKNIEYYTTAARCEKDIMQGLEYSIRNDLITFNGLRKITEVQRDKIMDAVCDEIKQIPQTHSRKRAKAKAAAYRWHLYKAVVNKRVLSLSEIKNKPVTVYYGVYNNLGTAAHPDLYKTVLHRYGLTFTTEVQSYYITTHDYWLLKNEVLAIEF